MGSVNEESLGYVNIFVSVMVILGRYGGAVFLE